MPPTKPELVNNPSAPAGLNMPDRKLTTETDLGPMTPSTGPAPPPTSPMIGLPFFDQSQFASSISSVLESASDTGRFASQDNTLPK